MKKLVNYASLVLIFSISSALIYFLQILFFQKPEDTFFYLFQDLAFVPVQALIVTLFLNKLIKIFQKQQSLKKVNVIISAFFSELGTTIIAELAKLNGNNDELSDIINLSDLNKKNINNLKKQIKKFSFKIQVTPAKLEDIGIFLVEKKSFMIGLLENSSLMEHDSFTDMLWSVFHVADELQNRDLKALSKADLKHLNIDILRAYRFILIEWVNYISYLNSEYPYLFNLAVNKSPFRQSKMGKAISQSENLED